MLLVIAVIAAVVLLRQPSSAPNDTENVIPWTPEALQRRTGALVDEIVFTQETDLGKVAGMIDAGTYHLFGQGITHTTVFHRLRDLPNATFDLACGSSSELTLNPVGPTFQNGELNPFHVPQIREALNWLINRRHISEELYGGLAVPRYLPLNTAFPDYAALSETVRRLEIRYSPDPKRARRVIAHHLTQMGAVMEKGTWHFKGRPVVLRLLIRSEDTRKQIGDYVGNLLEDIGFRVSRQYRTAEEGARIWFGGDPAAGQWHVYTGGWISTVINRDESQNLSFYYTPRGRSAPLWQAYTPEPELDGIAERLERRDYRTREERQALLERGLALAMRDSVRVWLVDQLSVFPRAEQISTAADLAGGITGSRLMPYTLRFRDRIGGRVVFATPSVLTEPWNFVAGSNWVFDSMIFRSLGDPPVLPDPFTGLYHPQRIASAEVTIEDGLPVVRTLDWLEVRSQTQIPVPADTWLDWHAAEGRFVTAAEKHPEGITARTRTRITYEDGYFERRWHDGTRISPADLVLPWILTFVRADSDSRLFDSSYTPGFEVFRQHFKGWRLLSTAPLVVEVYSDQIFPDAESIVAQRVSDVTPWHVLGIGIRAEEAGDLAFSSHKADQTQIGWMNLVAGPSLAILRRHLETATQQRYVPFADVLAPMMAEGEMESRYAALSRFVAERNHFWVGDGPFYLHSVHPVERILVLRRFADFPDPADKWLRFSRPEIPEATLDGPMMLPLGSAARFSLTVTFAGEAYPEGALDRISWLLFDGDGQLQTRGEAHPTGRGKWSIDVDADTLQRMGTGANSLEVAVISNRVALPTFVSHAFATVASGTRTLEDSP